VELPISLADCQSWQIKTCGPKGMGQKLSLVTLVWRNGANKCKNLKVGYLLCPHNSKLGVKFFLLERAPLMLDLVRGS
jgi:hypothetical protein